MRKLLFFLAVACYGQITPSVVAPDPQQQWLNAQGKPYVGAFLCTFIAGSSTPIATYVNSTATTTNTNPIVLDATGSATIWILPNVLYKYVLYVGGNGSCPGNGAVQWTRDFISTSSAGSAAIIPGSYPIGNPLTYLRSRPNVVTPILEYASQPVFVSTDYNFPTQFLSTDLTATVQATITLTPVPLGINASDLNHGIRIVDSITPSNSETVQIQPGGTAVSGTISGGTIKFTPTHNHSVYSIVSASNGILESAQICATAGGGQILIPSGINQISSEILLNTGCNLKGVGQSTVIKVSDQSYSETPNWAQNDGVAGYWVILGTKPISGVHASNVSFSNFTLDLNGSNQTGIPSAPNGISIGGSGNLVRDVRILNATNTVGSPPTGGPYFIPLSFLGVSNNNLADNVRVFNIPTSTGYGAGAFVDLGQWNSIVNSQAFNVGSPGAYIASAPALGPTWTNNFYSSGSSTIVSGTQQFCCDSAIGCIISGNKCNGDGSSGGIACFTTTTDSAVDTIGVTFSDNIATNALYGYLINGSTALAAFSKNIKIQGGSVINSGIGISVGDNVNNLQISGVNITGSTIADLNTTATVDHSITGLNVFGNSFNTGAAAQISINQSGTSVHPLYDAIFSLNHFTGATIAIFINTTATISKFNITNNIFNNSSSSDFHWLGGTLNTMATTPASNGAYCGNVTNAGSPTTNGCVSP